MGAVALLLLAGCGSTADVAAMLESRGLEVATAEMRLESAEPGAFRFFGGSVAASGDVVAVSSWGDSAQGRGAGSVEVFRRMEDETWVHEHTLRASDGGAGMRFGHSVAVQGDRVLVGAVYDATLGFRAGAAYVFARSAGEWTEEEKLLPSDGSAYGQFGQSVAIDGSTVVVGAPGFGARAAYVFERRAGAWVETAKLRAWDPSLGERFGGSVDVHAGTVVVGAWIDGSEVEGEARDGAAYIFRRQGRAWVPRQRLTAETGDAVPAFGWDVDLFGSTVLVAAPDSTQAVYVFERRQGAFRATSRLVASDRRPFDHFGSSVDLSGNVIVVGAPGHDGAGVNSGAVYAFQRSGGVWKETARVSGPPPSDDRAFGISVSAGSNRAVVGATGDDLAGTASGAAFVVPLR